MDSTRVYVPSTFARLRAMVDSGGIAPGPFLAHAVTEVLRDENPEGADEDWEYAALSAAAYDSLALIATDATPRRVVIAVDATSVGSVEQSDVTLVEVQGVPVARIAAVLVDTEDAEPDVAAAAASWVEAEHGDAAALTVVERCMERELAWFASQEIGDLLDADTGP